MRRLILLLIFTALATLVVVLPLQAPSLDVELTPELTSELRPSRTPHPPTPTVIWLPVTPPADALSEYDLIAIAANIARWNGLTMFEGPPIIKWQTVAEHEASMGSRSIRDQAAIVFTVAFRGTGVYRGFGAGHLNGPMAMDGFTVTLNALNGDVMTTVGGFDSRLVAAPYTGVMPTPVVLPDAVLLERAEDMVQAHRFELSGEPPVTAWMTMGEWLAARDIVTGVWDAEPMVFIAAFRGTGTWYTEENTSYQADGLTIALSQSGSVEGTFGGYLPPPYTSVRVYYEVRNEATQAAVERILSATPELE